MTRIETWPAELARLLLEYQPRPFHPADNNCVTFAAEWVKRATGRVIEIPVTATREDAEAAIAARGGLHAAVCATLGDPLASVALAHRGDIGITDLPGRGPALCVVVGPTVAFPGSEGLAYLRRSRLIAAWSV